MATFIQNNMLGRFATLSFGSLLLCSATLNLTDSVFKKSKCEMKTHLQKQPCHFNLLLQVSALLS